MDEQSRIEGHVPSAPLKARLEYEAQRVDRNLRVDEFHRSHIGHADFAPKPHLLLQRAGEERTVEVAIPEAEARAEFRLAEPEVGADEADVIEVDGEPFGLVAGNRLYLLVDLMAAYERVDEMEIDGDLSPEDALGRIVDAIVGPALERVLKNISEYDYTNELFSYVESKIRGRRDDLRSWRRNLRDTRSQLSRASDRVERLARECSDLRDKIQAFETHADTTIRDRIEGEFDSLLKMVPEPFPHLRVISNTLKLYTAPVTIEHGGKRYSMGRFRIDVSLRDIDLRIHAHENNQTADDHFHPHITPGGSPCWGNVGPGISQLLGERKVAEVMPIVWSFLNSYSAEAPYVEMDNYTAENAESD